MNGQDIVRVARSWIGTPWHHGAMLKGVGVDCACLLAGVAQELGVPVEFKMNYSTLDEFALMTGTLEKYCRELEAGEKLQDGDILVFRWKQMYNHCAFTTSAGTMIHAYNSPSVGRVVEQPLDESWLTRIAKRYRFRDVEAIAEESLPPPQ